MGKKKNRERSCEGAVGYGGVECRKRKEMRVWVEGFLGNSWDGLVGGWMVVIRGEMMKWVALWNLIVQCGVGKVQCEWRSEEQRGAREVLSLKNKCCLINVRTLEI